MGNSKPYVFADKNGEFTGFDIELFRDVARRIGFNEDQVIFTGQDFSALLPSVANGRFDVAVAAIGTTDARKQTVDFCDGYLAGYLSVITPDEKIKTEATGWQAPRRRPGHAPGDLCEKTLPRPTS